MIRKTTILWIAAWFTVVLTTGNADRAVAQSQPNLMVPQWIWSPDHIPGEVPQGACYFRKTVHLPDFKKAVINVAADDVYAAFVNGQPAGTGTSNNQMTTHDITSLLRPGKNTLAFKVENRNGQTAGLACEIMIDTSDDKARAYLTNPTWRTSLRVLPLWNSVSYRDSRWKAARNLGPYRPGSGPGGKSSDANLTPATPSKEEVTKVESENDNNPTKVTGIPGSQLAELVAKSQSSSTDRVNQQIDATRYPSTNDPKPNSSMTAGQQGSNLDRASLEARQIFAEQATPDALLGDKSPEEPARMAAAPQPAEQPVEDSPEFSVRPGFQIQHVAGHNETESLIAMAFNEFGQILASQEGGPLLMVYDSNDNGTPDKVRVCCEKVRSCQGILPVSGKVFVVGQGPSGAGIYELSDPDRDGSFEKVVALIQFAGNLGEHGPHGLALGPDGMIYVAIGNHTQLTQPYALSSPHHNYYEGEIGTYRYEDPLGHAAGIKAPGGGVLRIDLEGRRIELVAGGLRNSYDLAFNDDGDLFMHDSDMESDLGTPWHRPTRLLHTAMGGEYGWRSGYAKWPDYWNDTLPALIETGRGSPTGCIFYNHDVFPEQYRGALFSCDWSQGEINVFRTERDGSGYKTTRELFLRGKPLNVTDIDVGPDGWLYFCTGGRGTRGSIFRVVALDVPPPPKKPASGVLKAILQPQIQSAWARQEVSMVAANMKESWGQEVRKYVANRLNPPELRARALQLMHLIGPPPSDVELVESSLDPSPIVRNRCAFLLGLIGNDMAAMRLIEMLRDDVGYVRRQACDSLARTGQQVSLRHLKPLLSSSNRFEAWAARRALEQNESEDWQAEILATGNQRLFIQGATAMMVKTPKREYGLGIIEKFDEFTNAFLSDADFVDLLRLLEVAIERAELKPEDLSGLKEKLTKEFPAGNVRINRELARLLAFAQAKGAIEPMLDYLESPVSSEERIHVAIQMRFIEKGWDGKQRARLLSFLEMAGAAEGGKNLARYVDKISKDLIKVIDPAEVSEILKHSDLMPKVALACLFRLPEGDDEQHLESLQSLDQQISRMKGTEYDQLRVGLVAVLARGGNEKAMTYLRRLYDREPDRRSSIAMALAQYPEGRNWDYLVRSVAILDGDSAREVLKQLRTVNYAPESAEHIRQVILCGLRLKENGADFAADLLGHWVQTTPPYGGPDWESKMTAWQSWFEKTYPYNPVAALPVETGKNRWTFDDLVTFLSSSEGRLGSASRGAHVFSKAQCATCHNHGSIGRALGPDLTTINRRFQMREVVEAIVHPSQVVSDQYRSHTVYTNEGRQHTGLLIGTDEAKKTIVTSDGEEISIPTDEVDEILPVKISSMPDGLLNSLSLEEVADLFAFLMQTDGSDRMARKPSK